ncbi:hypothetical protein Tco_0670079 [Tanacetum coccineum]
MVHQKAILDLALQFDNACTTKEDLRKACRDNVITFQESMDSNLTNENDPWEYSLDIDDSDLHLTPVLRSSSSAHVEPSPYTPNPVTIIPGPAGAKLALKKCIYYWFCMGSLMSTQEYMQKVVEDVGEDADFNSGAWVSATNYVNAFWWHFKDVWGDIDNFIKREIFEQIVAIVKSVLRMLLEI